MYFCKDCGNEFNKWHGKCPMCGEWDTIKTAPGYSISKKENKKINKNHQELSNIFIDDEESGGEEMPCQIDEFSRVCKLYKKSVIIIGGEPGIGKSTLMCQIASSIQDNVLYLAGEESINSVKNRFQRVSANMTNVSVVNFSLIEELEKKLKLKSYGLIILDSIHTTRSLDLKSIKDIVFDITLFAKKYNCCVLLVSHITKDGIIAGPKTLEHMVDVVLYLEGERYGKIRFLRSIKNRFGATGETGIFEMKEEGMTEVASPSALMISNRQSNVPGSVIFSGVSGSRSLLIEIQSLVIESFYPNVECIGCDQKRVKMIIAILQRWCQINLQKHEIFVNIVGGMKLYDPATDLPIAMAILSSFKQRNVSSQVCFFGELGLTGEIRVTPDADMRIKEANRLNFKKIYANTGDSKDDVRLIADIYKML